jgi:hypothetical protein
MPTFAGELINAAVGVASLDDAALRGGYRVVADIAERNAIDGSDFDKIGCLVHVQANGVTYQRTATGWEAKAYTENTEREIYFALTGDDETGDGTMGDPFRTPQRCIDGLVDGQEGDVIFHALDDGPYAVPNETNVTPGPAGLNVLFAGNTQQAQTATIPAGAAPTLIPGTVGQYSVASGGFTDPITDGSHWMLDGGLGLPLDAFLFNFCATPIASPASPTINFVSYLGIFLGLDDVDVYPITAVFETQGNQTRIGAVSGGVRIRFAGIKFQNVGIASFENWNHTTVLNCNIDLLTSSLLFFFFNSSCFLPSGNVYHQNFENHPSSFVGGNLGNVTANRNVMLFVGGKVNVRITVNAGGSLSGSDDFDFVGTSTNECILIRPYEVGSSYVQLSTQINVLGSYTNFINCDQGAVGFIRGLGGGAISGSVSGTAYNLTSRVNALGIGAVSGSLTSAADVQVGNAGTFTYASLPQNDFTSPTGVGTVVES